MLDARVRHVDHDVLDAYGFAAYEPEPKVFDLGEGWEVGWSVVRSSEGKTKDEDKKHAVEPKWLRPGDEVVMRIVAPYPG